MKSKNLIILIILIALGIGVLSVWINISGPETEKETAPPKIPDEQKILPEKQEEEISGEQIPEEKEEQLSLGLQFVRKIEVGDGGYPNIILVNNSFYVSYQIGGGRIIVKVYDENFTATGEEHQLTGDEGWDHQMVFGNGYFYLVNTLYLRKFDSNWNEIDFISVTTGIPLQTSVGDMLLHYANDSLYLGNAVGNVPQTKGKKLDIPDNLYIRKYGENLEFENKVMLKDVGNTPGSSTIFQNGIFTLVTSDRHWDDSSLIMVRYDTNWNFIDNKTISAVSNANEEFPMGILFENGFYFVSYIHITGDLSQPTIGEPVRRFDVMLKVFDSDWKLMNQTIVTDDLPASDLAGHTRAPHVALVGDKIYVSYGIEGPKTFVKEYEIIYEL